MAIKGKKLVDAYKSFDRNQSFELPTAVKMIKERASVGKFDQTVEISMNLGVDPKHADQMVRGVVSLPHGTGKDVRIVASTAWHLFPTWLALVCVVGCSR